MTFVAILFVFTLLIFILISTIVNNKNYLESESEVMNSLLNTKSPHSSVFFETLKLFIKQGALVICILGIIVGLFIFQSNDFVDNNTYHYHRYVNLIQGKISSAAETIMNKERLYYEAVLQDKLDLDDLSRTGNIDYFEYEQRSKEIETKL